MATKKKKIKVISKFSSFLIGMLGFLFILANGGLWLGVGIALYVLGHYYYYHGLRIKGKIVKCPQCGNETITFPCPHCEYMPHKIFENQVDQKGT